MSILNRPLTAPYKIILLTSDANQVVYQQTIYDQTDPVNYPIIDGKLSLEINEAGSLEFTLAPDHPAVNAIEPYASYIRVLEGDNSIFYGRVVSKSISKVTTLASFQCTGALSFLEDSEVPPSSKDAQKKPQSRKMKAKAFFEWCIEQHNDETLDDRRYFTVGTINVSKKNEEDDYTLNGYTQTKSAITSNLIDVYGGFLRVRDTNGYLYLDWIEQYENVNTQPIQIGDNVQDQTNQIDGNNLFTILRPIGDNGITISDDPNEQDSDVIELYSYDDLVKYGRIVKSITFSANTKAKLRTKANAYKNKLQKTLFRSSSINWIDMHYLDGSTPRVSLGDRFTNIAGYEGTTMVVANMEIDLVAPWNNSLELRDKKSLDSDGSQTGHGHSGNKTLSGHSKSSSGQFFKWLREDGNMLSVLADIVDMHGITLNQHYETINTNAQVINTTVGTLSQVSGTVNSHTQKINNLETWVDDVNGTGFYQDKERIMQLAGQFEVWKDGSGKILGVKLKDGSDINITNNGISQTVGTRLNSVYDDVAQITGSALWTRRNNITGIVGEFEIENEGTPNEKLVIKTGGGIEINKNGTRFGVYDEGNLTAGVAIDIINGETEATIKADRIRLLGKTITDTINSTYIYNQIASMANVNVQLLTSELGGISVHSVATDSFYQGDISCYVPHAITSLRIQPNGNTYTLQRKRFSEDDWTDVGTFSRATSLSGEWSSRNYKVTASPQGNIKIGTVYDGLVPTGSVTKDGKTVKKSFIVYSDDEEGNADKIIMTKEVSIDATSVYNDGVPSSGTASGRSGSSYDWDFSITKGDGTKKTLTIDCSSIYSDARSGYTQGTFTQVSVTPISGSGVRLGSNETKYKRSS